MWGKTTEGKIDEDIGVSRLESISQDAPLLQNYIDGSSLPKYNWRDQLLYYNKAGNGPYLTKQGR